MRRKLERTVQTPDVFTERRVVRHARQSRQPWHLREAPAALAIVSIAALAGCGPRVEVGQVDAVTGFIGLIAADEPRSALVGRDILSAGGSAVDAAVAMAFTQTVTLPSRVGLGGGGACVVYKAQPRRTKPKEAEPPRAYAFLPQAAVPGETVALPGFARGLFTMHADYGVLRLPQLVSPAEQLARFGVQVSPAFAADLAAYREVISASPTLARSFGNLAQGNQMTRPDLASSLGSLRTEGPGTLYAGPLGRRMIEDFAQAGITLRADELRAYQPAKGDALTRSLGNFDMVTVPGTGGAAALDALSTVRTGTTLPVAGQDAVQSGILAIDQYGQAVACTFTQGAPFGTGRMGDDTGIIAARPLDPAATASGAAVLAVNTNIYKPYMAATATGVGAVPAMSRLIGSFYGGEPLDDSLAAAATAGADIGAAACTNGIPSDDQRCNAIVSPSSPGLAIR